jgi:hypothetical protein
MKTINSFASIAVLTAACVGLPAANAADSALERALRSSGGPASKPLILAYEKPRAMCKDDERNLPRGTMICREGKVFLCNPYGQWDNTGKPC